MIRVNLLTTLLLVTLVVAEAAVGPKVLAKKNGAVVVLENSKLMVPTPPTIKITCERMVGQSISDRSHFYSVYARLCKFDETQKRVLTHVAGNISLKMRESFFNNRDYGPMEYTCNGVDIEDISDGIFEDDIYDDISHSDDDAVDNEFDEDLRDIFDNTPDMVFQRCKKKSGKLIPGL